MTTIPGTAYDIVVIGAGHAGAEAALAAARLGATVAVLVLDQAGIGLMPCNPSIGGPGKGHLVREIDALGGEMARNIDATAIQIRMLNTGKGPAVQSRRAQADRAAYQRRMRRTLEQQRGLTVVADEAVALLRPGAAITGVRTASGNDISCRAVILATGTYLKARIHRGAHNFAGGPYDSPAAERLGGYLRSLGIDMVRFKTGTPPRVRRNSLDYSKMELLPGDNDIPGFSFAPAGEAPPQEPCWLTYTNERTHGIIRENMHLAALYSGAITGPGPRYCPSIEAKLVLFPGRARHQIFVEPEGVASEEMYLAGLSTSLPEEVQTRFVRSVAGLEKAEFTRFGYAIEYDCLDPLQLTHGLQLKNVPGLFAAGQINGTTGYEEAAAQGLMAGINAVRWLRAEPAVVLGRSEAYIGVLIDDLVTKGTGEPYRMLTSRAEYRLLLREGSADRRLTRLGFQLGLISADRHRAFMKRIAAIEMEKARLAAVYAYPNAASAAVLTDLESTPLQTGMSLADLLRRPEVSYAALQPLDPDRPALPPDIIEEVEADLRYAGYIARQERQVAAHKRMEERRLPEDMNYAGIGGLSREALEKFGKVQPVSVGQAARIPGVSPADIDRLLMYLAQRERERKPDE